MTKTTEGQQSTVAKGQQGHWFFLGLSAPTHTKVSQDIRLWAKIKKQQIREAKVVALIKGVQKEKKGHQEASMKAKTISLTMSHRNKIHKCNELLVAYNRRLNTIRLHGARAVANRTLLEKPEVYYK